MKRSHLAICVAVLFAVALHAFVFKSQETDYEIFVRAAERLLAGAPLYPETDIGSGEGWTDRTFKYAPPAAAFFIPFLFLGRGAFLLLSVAALALTAFWASRATQRSPLLPVLLLLPLAHHAFSLGQSDSIVLGLFAASELTRAKRPWLSAVLAAGCIVLKVTFIVPVLAMVVVEKRRDAWRVLVALVAFGLVPFSLTPYRDWLTLLSKTTPPLICRPANQGVWAIFCDARPLVYLSAVAFAGAVLWRWRRSPFGVAAAATFFAALWSPLCWRSTLVCILPALFLARRAALVPAALLAIPLYDVFGPKALSFALEHRLFGLCALAFFSVGLVEKPDDAERER